MDSVDETLAERNDDVMLPANIVMADDNPLPNDNNPEDQAVASDIVMADDNPLSNDKNPEDQAVASDIVMADDNPLSNDNNPENQTVASDVVMAEESLEQEFGNDNNDNSSESSYDDFDNNLGSPIRVDPNEVVNDYDDLFTFSITDNNDEEEINYEIDLVGPLDIAEQDRFDDVTALNNMFGHEEFEVVEDVKDTECPILTETLNTPIGFEEYGPNFNRYSALAIRFSSFFDPKLSVDFKYLGNGFVKPPDRNLALKADSVHTIAVVFLKINLMVDQVFPMIGYTHTFDFFVKYVLANSFIFGVSLRTLKSDDKRLFGTIAEVYEYSENAPNNPPGQVRLKSKGGQRFEILDMKSFPDSNVGPSICLAQVKIIPDVTFNASYKDNCLNPVTSDLIRNEKCGKRDMCLSPWPNWVYNQCDSRALASRLNEKVQVLFNESVQFSDDPYKVSLQVLKLGLMSNDFISHCLSIPHTNERLKAQLDYLETHELSQNYCCINCASQIFAMCHVLPMSPEGVVGCFSDDRGDIFEMMTMSRLNTKVDHPIFVGHRFTSSVFQGYRARPLFCPKCWRSLGYLYATENEYPLLPAIFYGIILTAVTCVISVE